MYNQSHAHTPPPSIGSSSDMHDSSDLLHVKREGAIGPVPSSQPLKRYTHNAGRKAFAEPLLGAVVPAASFS